MIWEGEWPGWHGIDEMVPRKRLTMGWEDHTWARGSVQLLLPPGWSWLDYLGDGVNCFVVFFLIFWKSMVIDGWEKCFVCCRGQWRPPGWEVNSSAFWNIIPVTTPIELRRLLMLPRRKERGETSPKILLNCWVKVVKIPLCSDGLENGVKCSKVE